METADIKEDLLEESSHIGENKNSPTFHDVPVEILLHICSFLDVKDIVLTLSVVCKRFYSILTDESVWKTWFVEKWNVQYPIGSIIERDFNWRLACLAMEKEVKLWQFHSHSMENCVSTTEGHISDIDAVLLVNDGKTCISAARDRSLGIWDVQSRVRNQLPFYQQHNAHKGWIWRLLKYQNMFYTSSWDNSVKGWSLEQHSLQEISVFKCTTPVLSLAILDQIVYAGDFAKKVCAFDPRIGVNPIFTYVPHSMPVLTIGASGHCVISGSEDKFIAVWDTRKKEVIKKVTISNDNSYPNSSSMDDDVVYIGDNKGNLHVFNPREDFNRTGTFNMDYQKPISVVKHSHSYIVTGSLDGTFKISLPSYPPKHLANLRSCGKEVSGLDYCNGVMAVSASNTVEFWIPKADFNY